MMAVSSGSSYLGQGEEGRGTDRKVKRYREEEEEMAVSATVIGALLGLGTQMYSNALRKLPYMRPWELLLGMGLGAVFVNQLVNWDAQLQRDLDSMLEKAKAANERRYFG
ncbi:hypothetical protein GOBAR_AA11449 [Gossypium barbadense]|uniref:Uncharacterized protein n=1 Tax=Gossypium barbadense TaxID=3634 RepID=A0A2P5Y0R9_GOSBA|nr:hypothetical protein GOBAR_AA11449 [Gossypium barbadense]